MTIIYGNISHDQGEPINSKFMNKNDHSERDLTTKFWRLMGFMTTGGPAVRGHA